ncbi:inner centromere protein A-like [Clytia hemisphaerica]|uniref:Inner centromere protein ARK-binding domain-containing protein n=1 Tax=Clytia hemisphaerica TaxID=252671 RepID=A0A7M5XGF9_9CNID
MMDTNAACIISIFEAAKEKFDQLSELMDDNFLWLEQIQEEARKAFGRNSLSLLPKTPGVKRKRPALSSQNDQIKSPSKCSSTFVDESENKKFKIDDMSTIAEISDVSVFDNTQNTSTRSLRPRKKKSAPRPLKKSKRIAKQRASNLNKSIENKKNSTIVLDTPSPILGESTLAYNDAADIVDDTISKISPINHPIQPHVASVIKLLAKSTQKVTSKKSISHPTNMLDDVKISLFGYQLADDEMKMSSPSVSLIPRAESVSTPIEMALDPQRSNSVSTPKEASLDPKTPKTITKSKSVLNDIRFDVLEQDSPDEIESPSPSTLAKDLIVSLEDISSPKRTTLIPQTPHTLPKTSCESGEASDEKTTDDSMEYTIDDIKQEEILQLKQKEVIEPQSVDHKSQTQNMAEQEASCVNDSKGMETSGRRDTYKVMVQQAQSPSYERYNSKLFEISDDVKANSPASFVSKGPKIIKPISGKNIVSGVKSFLNRGTTPPRVKNKEELYQKKAADLEKKEQQRQKAVDEANQRKQKLMEMKKKQRDEREKRLLEIRAKRQEEEERRRKEMEMRNNKSQKNREEIKRIRELEDKKKRELREMKTAVAEQRRLKEEEQQQKRIHLQIEEEERRCEMMKRKMEYEEQERLKKKHQAEKDEKDRLKQLEKDKLLQEERKIRELEEKERHRQEVERKLKEERERERLEKQKQEQRIRQAEKEIAEANKKREIEADKASNLKKNNTFTTQNAKNKTFSPSVVVGKENIVKATYKNSPNNGAVKGTVKPAFKAPIGLPLKLRESTYTSYDIDDLNSDDSTDDEAEPCRRIPSWAQGIELKSQLLYQFHNQVDPDDIFINCMEPCRLDKIFLRNKERYFKRTSSAHWDSPILKTKVYR